MITEFEQGQPREGEIVLRVTKLSQTHIPAAKDTHHVLTFDHFSMSVTKAVYDEVERRILANPQTPFRLKLVAE